MNLTLEEIQLVKKMRQEGMTYKDIAFLLVRKDLSTASLIELYEQEYKNK